VGALFSEESRGVALGCGEEATGAGAGGITLEGADCGPAVADIAFVPRHAMYTSTERRIAKTTPT